MASRFCTWYNVKSTDPHFWSPKSTATSSKLSMSPSTKRKNDRVWSNKLGSNLVPPKVPPTLPNHCVSCLHSVHFEINRSILLTTQIDHHLIEFINFGANQTQRMNLLMLIGGDRFANETCKSDFNTKRPWSFVFCTHWHRDTNNYEINANILKFDTSQYWNRAIIKILSAPVKSTATKTFNNCTDFGTQYVTLLKSCNNLNVFGGGDIKLLKQPMIIAMILESNASLYWNREIISTYSAPVITIYLNNHVKIIELFASEIYR